MLCAGKSILLTRCSQNRVVACAAPQQQPKKVSATLASVNPSPAASSAPSEPKKAAQKSPAPTTTQAVKPKKVRAPRALSPYNYFVKTNFTRIAALHPERKGVPAMSREISAAWDALSEKDKAPYLAAAEKSKKEVSEKRAVLKAQAKALARPINAYPQFVVENYPVAKSKNPGMTFIETTKVVRSMWASLPESDKAKFTAAQNAKIEEWKAKQNGA